MRTARALFLNHFSKSITGRRSSQNLENFNPNMPNSSLDAFLMIHWQCCKKIFIAENKEMGTLSKTSPTRRIPPALLCCVVTHMGEAAPKRFIKINRPGNRGSPSGRTQRGWQTTREKHWKWGKNKEGEREGQVRESLERRREVWGVVRRAGAPLSSSPALWRLSKEPRAT